MKFTLLFTSIYKNSGINTFQKITGKISPQVKYYGTEN